MQTFLPYPDLAESAGVLDDLRLGNQCYRECVTLIRGGWRHHPASLMWSGYEHALARYGYALAREMSRRRRPDGSRRFRVEVCRRWQEFWIEQINAHRYCDQPPWLGDERLHSSHRACLLFKLPQWYSLFDWKERPTGPDDMGRWPYFWPEQKRA